MSDADFARRLRETFALEARENIDAMSACLVELERSPEMHEHAVEEIFRKCHSLKGAARAVNNTGIEMLCHHMENCFSALKRRQQAPLPESMVVFHRAVEAMDALLVDEAAISQERLQALKRELTPIEGRMSPALTRPVDDFDLVVSKPTPSVPGRASEIAQTPPLAPPEELRAQSEEANPQARRPRIVHDTVRTRLSDMEALLRHAEDLYAKVLEQQELLPRIVDIRHRLEGEEQAAHDLGELHRAARTATHDLHQTAAQLFECVREMQMLPFSTVLEPLSKMARDIAREQGKQVEVRIAGGEIGIDKQVLDSLYDPLVHLMRNAIDHGIEKPAERIRRGKAPTAVVRLEATQRSGGAVELVVADDGAGIDLGKVRGKALQLGMASPYDVQSAPAEVVANWIFKSGLSTSPMVTNLSGRGLGMAIVREKVEALNGTVTCTTEQELGTSFHLRLPVTLSSMRAVEVVVGEQTYLLPSRYIDRAVALHVEDTVDTGGQPTLRLNNALIPLHSLADLLEISPAQRRQSPPRTAVVVQSGESRVALTLDELRGEHEILMKPLGHPLKRVRNVAGAAMRGGEPVVVLHAPDLVRSAAASGGSAKAPEQPTDSAAPARVLVADDSLTSRMLLKDILTMSGYQVETAVDGMDALTKLREGQYDALVSDVDMPRLSGFELTQRVRADDSMMHLPVVLVTSLSSREDYERGIEVGANAYIVKSSFDQGQLLDVLRTLA